MLKKGQGIPADMVQAHKWLNLSAGSGDQNAIEGRKALEVEMTPKQIENAQNLARESGMNLGKIINVYEGYSSPVMYSAKAMGGGISDSSAPIPTIQPGQQEIDVTINLTYQVK